MIRQLLELVIEIWPHVRYFLRVSMSECDFSHLHLIRKLEILYRYFLLLSRFTYKVKYKSEHSMIFECIQKFDGISYCIFPNMEHQSDLGETHPKNKFNNEDFIFLYEVGNNLT